MRRILDALADAGILAALVVAAIGQFMPWMTIYADRTRCLTPAHAEFGQFRLVARDGFSVALVPTIIATVVCAARMVWTMAWRCKGDGNRPPALA